MMHERTRDGDFDDLASDYDRFRVGYSTELFDVLEDMGVRRGMSVLDAGCGTGLSAQPLAARGVAVTGIDPSVRMLDEARKHVPAGTFVEGRIERLPFAGDSFDAAVCAQAFHWFDGDAAFAELLRVVKPGGPIAVWWKLLGSDEPLRAIRAAAAGNVGVDPPSDPLRGGFQAFYRAAFATRTLRVLPFIARFSVDDWLGYERSRAAARNGYGDRREAYLSELHAGLIAKFGSPSARFEVRYTQYVYLGRSAS